MSAVAPDARAKKKSQLIWNAMITVQYVAALIVRIMINAKEKIEKGKKAGSKMKFIVRYEQTIKYWDSMEHDFVGQPTYQSMEIEAPSGALAEMDAQRILDKDACHAQASGDNISLVIIGVEPI